MDPFRLRHLPQRGRRRFPARLQKRQGDMDQGLSSCSLPLRKLGTFPRREGAELAKLLRLGVASGFSCLAGFSFEAGALFGFVLFLALLADLAGVALFFAEDAAAVGLAVEA